MLWLKQVCHDKGNRGEGGGITSAGWERFFQLNGTNVARFPLPTDLPLEAGRLLDDLAQQLAATTPDAVATAATPDRDRLATARSDYDHLRARMIYEQEELDWVVTACCPTTSPPPSSRSVQRNAL